MRCCAAPASNFFDGMAGKYRRRRCAAVAAISSDEDVSRFLAGRKRLERVAIRHTVGMDDKVEGEGGVADPKENAGARYFKLKLNGDPEHDAARLIRIGSELAALPYDYQRHAGCQRAICRSRRAWRAGRRLDRDAALRPIAAKLLYIEQPMPRDITRQSPLGALGAARFHHRRGRRFL